MSKRDTDDEILARLDESLARDLLADEYGDEEIARILREAGGDPEAISRRGAALAAEMLERQRLSWQERAREKIKRRAAIVDNLQTFAGMPRAEILRRLEHARHDMRLSGTVTAAFHKRRPEDSSDDELRALLGEIEALRELEAISCDDEDDEK